VTTVLQEGTITDQHGVVQFLEVKQYSAKDIHKDMLPLYRKNCMLSKVVYNWVEEFIQGLSKFEDNHRTGSLWKL
jgi:hypothetical protein